MPLEINNSINAVTDRILKSTIIKNTFSNPIYTALIFAVIITLLSVVIFRNVSSNESLLVLSMRTGFWSFLFILCGLFLHNKVLMGEIEMKRIDSNYKTIFDGGNIASDLFEESVVPINLTSANI